MSATTHDPAADGGLPLVPILLSLGLELGRRSRHEEAADALRKALAEEEADKPVDTITEALLEQLLAARDREGALRTGLELAATAPAAVAPTLRRLTSVLRPSLLQPVAEQLAAVQWLPLLASDDVDLATRRGLLTFLGRAHLVLGDAERAASVLEGSAAIIEGDAELLLLLADSQLRAWRFDLAEQTLTRAAVAAGSTELAAQVILRQARLYEQTGRPAETLDRLRDISDGDPERNAELHGLKALALLGLGDLDGARQAAGAALAAAPGSAPAAVAGTCVCLADHDYPRATDTADAGLAKHPQHKALSFLRFQAIVEAGDELDRIDRRLSRFLDKMPPDEIDLYVRRSERTRSADDPALHYFLGMLYRALDRPDDALAALDRAIPLLDKEPVPRQIPALAHRLRAMLLEPDDPDGAAAAYTTAGLRAFDQEHYELSVDLLRQAGKLRDLSQLARWMLAEALFFLSFVPTEPGGVALDKIRQADDVWREAMERGLPEPEIIWAYVSGARINLQLARVTPDPYALLAEAMLFCESFAVCSVGTEASFLALGTAYRLLGLYGLQLDMYAEAVGPPAQRNVDPLPVEQLVAAAANAGDLPRMRAALATQRYLATSEVWREDEARYHILNEDWAAARASLDAIPPEDRSPMYHHWLRIRVDWQLADRTALEADLVRGAKAAERNIDGWAGLAGWLLLLSGDAQRAMEQFAGQPSADSWFTDPSCEVALCRLVQGDADGAAEVGRYIAEASSYEDVHSTGTLLGVLAERYPDAPDGALARLRQQAEERLAAGGWPLDLPGDLDRLVAGGENMAQLDDLIVVRAVRARVAIRNQAWSEAIVGYLGLIPHLDKFPEVETALAWIAGELGALADSQPDQIAAPASELAEVIAELRRHGSRRIGPQPPELQLGDVYFVLRDIERARELYQAGADLPGAAETRGHALTRLHVLSALENRPDAGTQLAEALRTYRDAGVAPVATVCQTSLAMITDPAEWRRLLEVWDDASGAHEFADELTLAGRHSLAALYQGAGQWAEAEGEYRDVVLARTRVLGPDHAETLASRHELGRVLAAQGNWDDAGTEFQAVTEIRQRVLGALDAATLTSQAELAWVLYCRGDLADAEQVYREVVAGYGTDSDVLAIRHELGLTLLAKDEYAAARIEFQAVAEGREALQGPNDTMAIAARYQDALAVRLLGDPAAAAAAFEAVLTRQRAVLGEAHPDTLATRHQLAITMAERADYPAAAAEFADVAAARIRVLGPLDPVTVNTRRELASALLSSGEFPAAIEEYRAVADARAETLGESDPATLSARREVAFAVYRQGDYPAAEAEYRAVLSAMRVAFGDDDEDTVGVWHEWALLLQILEDWPASITELRTVLAKLTALRGEDHPDTLTTRKELARSMAAGGDQAGAEAEFRAVLAGWTRAAGPDDLATLDARGDLAAHLASTGDPAAAEAEYRILAEAGERALGEHDEVTLTARWELAWLLSDRSDWSAAEAEYRKVIEGRAATQDPAEGAARYRLGLMLRLQHRFDEAVAELNTAIGMAPADADRLAARLQIGLARAGLAEWDAAEAELRAVVDGRAELLGPDADETVSARTELAHVLASQEKWEQAEAEFRAVAQARERTDGPDDPGTLVSRFHLATAIAGQGRSREAAAEFRAVLERELEVFGADHPNTLATRNELIDVLIKEGDLEAAEAECRSGVEALTEMLGADHPETLLVRQRLAFVLSDREDLDAAEPEYRTVLADMEHAFGLEARNTLTTRSQLAGLLFRAGKFADAEAEFRAVLAGLRETVGPDDPQTLSTRMDLGTALQERGEYADAIAELRATAEDQDRVLGADAPDTQETRRRLAYALAEGGEAEAGEAEFRDLVATVRRAYGAEDPEALGAQSELARFLAGLGNPAAVAEFRAAADAWDRAVGPDHHVALAVRYNLGGALADQERWAEAEIEYRAVLERETQLLGPLDPSTLMTHHELAATLVGKGDLEVAIAELRTVLAARMDVLGEEDPATVQTRITLAKALAAQGEAPPE